MLYRVAHSKRWMSRPCWSVGPRAGAPSSCGKSRSQRVRVGDKHLPGEHREVATNRQQMNMLLCCGKTEAASLSSPLSNDLIDQPLALAASATHAAELWPLPQLARLPKVALERMRREESTPFELTSARGDPGTRATRCAVPQEHGHMHLVLAATRVA